MSNTLIYKVGCEGSMSELFRLSKGVSDWVLNISRGECYMLEIKPTSLKQMLRPLSALGKVV